MFSDITVCFTISSLSPEAVKAKNHVQRCCRFSELLSFCLLIHLVCGISDLIAVHKINQTHFLVDALHMYAPAGAEDDDDVGLSRSTFDGQCRGHTHRTPAC